MTNPKSLDAYEDCETHFERALLSPKGIAITLDSQAQATRFSQKMNTYRERLRKQSRKVRSEDDPLYGTSPYDKFQLTRDPENPARVFIRVYRIDVQKVEEL